jgi:hypothetical protein
MRCQESVRASWGDLTCRRECTIFRVMDVSRDVYGELIVGSPKLYYRRSPRLGRVRAGGEDLCEAVNLYVDDDPPALPDSPLGWIQASAFAVLWCGSCEADQVKGVDLVERGLLDVAWDEVVTNS